jgi:hypothetical protein
MDLTRSVGNEVAGIGKGDKRGVQFDALCLAGNSLQAIVRMVSIGTLYHRPYAHMKTKTGCPFRATFLSSPCLQAGASRKESGEAT